MPLPIVRSFISKRISLPQLSLRKGKAESKHLQDQTRPAKPLQQPIGKDVFREANVHQIRSIKEMAKPISRRSDLTLAKGLEKLREDTIMASLEGKIAPSDRKALVSEIDLRLDRIDSRKQNARDAAFEKELKSSANKEEMFAMLDKELMSVREEALAHRTKDLVAGHSRRKSRLVAREADLMRQKLEITMPTKLELGQAQRNKTQSFIDLLDDTFKLIAKETDGEKIDKLVALYRKIEQELDKSVERTLS